MPLNIEFKARCAHLAQARAALRRAGAVLVGIDRQLDTYFHVPHGRLKLREGTVERALIFYERPDTPGPKRADVLLHPTPEEAASLKAVLTAALGVRVVVDKTREIYRADNVKLHLDRVESLGTFVEVEAIDTDGSRNPDALRVQCDHFLHLLGVQPEDFVAASYGEMVRA